MPDGRISRKFHATSRDRLGGLLSGGVRTYNVAYTKFVRVLRLVLPLAAIAIIGLLMSWPRLEDTMETVPPALQQAVPGKISKNELIDPRFESMDKENRPFTVSAARAVQSARDPEVVILEKPRADMTLKNNSWLAGEADKGAYRQNEEKLVLEGNVRLFHDQGYEVKMDKLLVNLKTGKAWSDADIYGQGPAGTLKATGMKADSASQTLVFTGPVRLVLNRSVRGL